MMTSRQCCPSASDLQARPRLAIGQLAGVRQLALAAVCACLMSPEVPHADVGALTPMGCIENTGGTECTAFTAGLAGAVSVALSPDGANMYVASDLSDAIVTFARGAGGALTPAGCVQNTGGTDCTGTGGTTAGLDAAHDVAVSPDGTNVYVASLFSSAIVAFARSPSGVLTPAGCVQHTFGTDCTFAGGTAPGLGGASGIALSPDGANVYVASHTSNAVVTFARSPSGALTFVGCIQNTGGTECTGTGGTTAGLDGAASVVVSPDGANVYVASLENSAIVAFARGAGGALTPGGCVQNTGGLDCLAAGGTAPGLGGAFDLALSPDGTHVYVASYHSDALVQFARGAGGGLTPAGCIQNTGGTDCTGLGGTAAGLDGAAGVAVSADGSSVYVVSYYSAAIALFARGAGGALTPGGCVQNTGGTDCTFAGGTASGLDGAYDVALSPDGTNVYVASDASDALVAFGREVPPTPTTTTTLPPTTDHLLPGRITIIRAGTLAKVVAKPATGGTFALPSVNPVAVGGALRIFDTGATAGDDTYSLPAGGTAPLGWKGLGRPAGTRGYKYKGAGTSGDPCRVVLVKGKVIKAVCTGAGITLQPPFTGDVGIVLRLGTSERYCVQFGGVEAKNDADGTKRKDASARTTCP